MARSHTVAEGHGEAKFPNAGVLASSKGRRWEGVLVEQRAHPAGEIPAFAPTQTEITMILAANRPARVLRRGNGCFQDTLALPATTWLCPVGVYEDCIRITDELPSVLHMYIPDVQFCSLASEHGLAWSGAQAIRYEAGLQDPLIEQIGRTLLAELLAETSAGAILASSLACSLAARLMSNYADYSRKIPGGPTILNSTRLHRVFDFIDSNLHEDLKLADLAGVAALSQFHFLRAFKAATGIAPYRYLSAKRLERAKILLKDDRHTLADIAIACSFSSQANFSRAFQRSTGLSPGRYRSLVVGKPIELEAVVRN